MLGCFLVKDKTIALFYECTCPIAEIRKVLAAFSIVVTHPYLGIMKAI
jgi:hypothetical protein